MGKDLALARASTPVGSISSVLQQHASHHISCCFLHVVEAQGRWTVEADAWHSPNILTMALLQCPQGILLPLRFRLGKAKATSYI